MDQANTGGVIRKSVPGWMQTDIRPLSLSVVLIESVTATLGRHKETSDERQEETTCLVDGVVD